MGEVRARAGGVSRGVAQRKTDGRTTSTAQLVSNRKNSSTELSRQVQEERGLDFVLGRVWSGLTCLDLT